jgi:hypothetical protein
MQTSARRHAGPRATGTPATAGWLYGPATDLLLGAGGAYLLTLPLLLVAESAWGIGGWPAPATLALGLLISTPHYGATLLRVYEQREDRQRYALFAVHASLFIAAAFVAGVYQAGIAAMLVTLYFCWSPWHFAGQNYGLTLMLLRRSGLQVPDGARRALYLAYIASFLVTLLMFHTREGSAAFAPDFDSDGRGYGVLRLGVPQAVTAVLAPALIALLIAGFGVALLRLRRAGAGAVQLGLTLLLGGVQTLWFVLPVVFALFGRPVDGLAFTAVWASVAHSAQYLWVTSYTARSSASGASVPRFYTKALLGGCLIGVVPGLLFAPFLLGGRPWTGGLSMLVFACVNLHHFVLDGAVWKLRDGRVARLLLRPPDARPAAAAGATNLARAVWALGGLCLAVEAVELWDVRAAQGTEVSAVSASARRLAWIGRDRASVLGRLGDLRAGAGDPAGAFESYREALAVRRDATVLNNFAWSLAVHGTESDAEQAIALAREALAEFGDTDVGTLDTLAVAYAAAGRYEEAIATAEHAVNLARDDDPELAADVASRLARYREHRSYRAP